MDCEKNILIIEDDKDSRELLKIYLKKWNYNIFEALDPDIAINKITEHNIQLALIDWVLDEVSGLEICNTIRKKLKDKYIYIIMITGKKTKDDVVEALREGADDYLIKPFNFEELRVRIEAGERIINYQNHLKNNYIKLYEASLIDTLTKIYNRKTILDKLNSEFQRAKRLNNNLSVIMCDIDYFKKINDSYGHIIGDKILENIGEILKTNLRLYDSAGRYGGEEFLLILPDTDTNTAYKVADRIKKYLENNHLKVGKFSIPVTMSFGISSSSGKKSISELIDNADKQLYKAKRAGRNRIILAS